MRHGYTLLELMVALTIFAMLVGVATPIYVHQLNKSRVAAAISTLNDIDHVAKVAYEENSSNTTIEYAGATLTNNVITTINVGSVVNALYIPPSGHANVADNQYLVCVFVDNLNFSDYVAPPNGGTGTHARICKQVTATDSIYTNMCGSLEGGILDVPVTYLPTSCDCSNIWAGTC